MKHVRKAVWGPVAAAAAVFVSEVAVSAETFVSAVVAAVAGAVVTYLTPNDDGAIVFEVDDA